MNGRYNNLLQKLRLTSHVYYVIQFFLPSLFRETGTKMKTRKILYIIIIYEIV
jgi:hypothetical protein